MRRLSRRSVPPRNGLEYSYDTTAMELQSIGGETGGGATRLND